MNEPILTKAKPHGYDYKPITWGIFLQLRDAAQKTANSFGHPVYLVGSALHKILPRDIDISVIMPLNDFEKMFGELPKKQECYPKYLGEIFVKSFDYIKDLYFFVDDYHLDIKVCPDTWWTEKDKFLLAKPR